MGRARSLAVAAMLLLGATAPVLATPTLACAAIASGSGHAALVVDTGPRTTTYCVALDQPSVDGAHLIELASEQYGLSYRLGFGGRAVCMLAGVGVAGEDCFGDYPNFWGYFHGAGASAWTWASGSAADHQVRDGDRDAWSWGTGDSNATHPAPPATSIEDVCGPAPTPLPSPTPHPSPAPSPATTPSPVGGGGASDSGGGADGGGIPRHTVSPEPSAPPSATAAASTSRSPDVVRATAASPPASNGPPVGGLMAVAAIAALGVGGRFMVRRRRAGG